MKRILINATHNEEIRVALCKDNHLYDFDLENRTREQKKANIYKGHVTRVEPSLEAVFVEYGSARQGFLPLREIAPEYLNSDVRSDNIKHLIKEGDEIIVQVEKEERGNKGAALSTYISLAGRYLVLMPNNNKAGGISRQISGKVRDEMKQIIASLSIPRGMSVIVRTAGLGKGFEDLQNDLNHLLDIWASILEQNRTRPSPCLVHQEAGVVTRAVRDYLRDDIGEVWIDSENAYNEAAHFIASVMPNQMGKLRKYTDYEPLFARFGIERQIETAYQREVRLPSGGSIVIDQTEAMVAIDINSAKSTKGSDVAETAYHTNLEAADEIARQLRLRDMGGLIVIDFIDMNDARHQKDVEKRLIDATRYDRARVQFAEISKFGLMEMSRQRLRPSLEEATGYICPRCHGNGMIRDLRSLALSIMRQIEQIALKERYGEIQAEVPTEIAAFLLNEKRESLVYLEQDSSVRITILPHAHLESPNFSLHYNPDGFAPSSYERIIDVEERESGELGYDTNWHTKVDEVQGDNRWQKATSSDKPQKDKTQKSPPKPEKAVQPQAVAWLSNLFAPKPQARLAGSLGNQEVAAAIESLVNGGAVSLGAFGTLAHEEAKPATADDERKPKTKKPTPKPEPKAEPKKETAETAKPERKTKKEEKSDYPKREAGSQREPRGEVVRGEPLKPSDNDKHPKDAPKEKIEKKERTDKDHHKEPKDKTRHKATGSNDVTIQVIHHSEVPVVHEVVHISLDDSKSLPTPEPMPTAEPSVPVTVPEQPAQPEQTAVVATETTLPNDKDTATPTPNVALPIPTQESVTIAIKTDEPVSTETTQDNARLNALAQAMNKAVNDPRVLTAYHTKPIAITGTAGEFIQTVLGKTEGDFVANFLTALAHHRSLSETFDFANYGYAPLTAEYLDNFHKTTSPNGQYGIAQGKTQAIPRQTPRASNDPRGALPEPEAVTAHETALPDVSAVQTAPTEPPQAIVESAVPITIATDEASEATVNEATVKEQTADDQDNKPVCSDEPKTDDTAEPPKTDSKKNYKDMIENVSGQLLPQLGILSLVAPKKPKATKPKTAKNPIKKTSKAAQKAEVVKRKSKNDDVPDSPDIATALPSDDIAP